MPLRRPCRRTQQNLLSLKEQTLVDFSVCCETQSDNKQRQDLWLRILLQIIKMNEYISLILLLHIKIIKMKHRYIFSSKKDIVFSSDKPHRKLQNSSLNDLVNGN